MSVKIGETHGSHFDPQLDEHASRVLVSASYSGVELTSLGAASFTMTPTEARNYGSLLVRAADEVERMRQER